MASTYFVTGANGCIGSWVIHELIQRGDSAVVFDLSEDARRMRLLMDDDQWQAATSGAAPRLRFVQGDITDRQALQAAVSESGAKRVIHLAGLQVPFCKADPILGATVNVVGTLQIFEAALEAGCERVVYASSAAVYGPDEDYVPADGEQNVVVTETDGCQPTTLYGAYKYANEQTARIYHQDRGLHSVGLRPLTVFGVARDQGMTSTLTRALHAAVLGRKYTIPFGGRTDVLYTRDCALAFLACADSAPDGAHVFNLHGDDVEVAEFARLADEVLPEAHRGLISVEGQGLPIASALQDGAMRAALGDATPPTTKLIDGIRETVQMFTALHEQNRIDTRDLED